MSKIHFAPQSLISLVRSSEELSTALFMIHNQDLNAAQYSSLQSMTCSLLTRLSDDLESAVVMIGLIDEQGGKGSPLAKRS